MSDRLVMRSVYLRESEDSELRQIAFEIDRPKSDLIRAAISANLKVWRQLNDPDAILRSINSLDQNKDEDEEGVYEHQLRKPKPAKPAPAARKTVRESVASESRAGKRKSGTAHAQTTAREMA